MIISAILAGVVLTGWPLRCCCVLLHCCLSIFVSVDSTDGEQGMLQASHFVCMKPSLARYHTCLSQVLSVNVIPLVTCCAVARKSLTVALRVMYALCLQESRKL